MVACMPRGCAANNTQCKAGIIHPGWSAAAQHNDIALCFLERSTRLGFQPVTLANSSEGQHLVVLSASGCPAA